MSYNRNQVDDPEIFAIRVDQNKDSFFKCFSSQKFNKSGLKILEIYQDMNALIQTQTRLYKVVAETKGGTPFVWQKFENPSNIQVTYREPDKSDLDLINELYESTWDIPSS